MTYEWDDLRKAPDDLPEEDCECLVEKHYDFGKIEVVHDIVMFSKDLKKLDEYGFQEGGCGFVQYDSEYGFSIVCNVVGWARIKPMDWSENENKSKTDVSRSYT